MTTFGYLAGGTLLDVVDGRFRASGSKRFITSRFLLYITLLAPFVFNADGGVVPHISRIFKLKKQEFPFLEEGIKVEIYVQKSDFSCFLRLKFCVLRPTHPLAELATTILIRLLAPCSLFASFFCSLLGEKCSFLLIASRQSILVSYKVFNSCTRSKYICTKLVN